MARSGFTTANYLLHSAALFTAPPFSFACWFNSSSVASAGQFLFNIGDVDSATGFNNFGVRLVSGAAHVTCADGVSLVAGVTSTTYSANTWNHACGVFASSTSRSVYLNGGGKVTETTSKVPSGVDRTSLGVRVQSTVNNPLSGIMAVPAFWNVALPDDDAAMLAAGFHPSLIRPDALVALWDLDQGFSPEPDYWGNFAQSLTGSPTQADDPPLIYPSGIIQVTQGTAAPPAGFKAAWASSRSKLIGGGVI